MTGPEIEVKVDGQGTVTPPAEETDGEQSALSRD